MYVCVFVTRREEKKKTRKEDFGGVYTVRESHINIFHITRSFLFFLLRTVSLDSNTHYQRNENIGEREKKQN